MDAALVDVTATIATAMVMAATDFILRDKLYVIMLLV